MVVLVCDDRKDELNKIKDTLSDMAIVEDVLTCTDGKEAIELSKNNSIDLIISDIDMPKVNGLDAIRIIKQKYNSSVNIIFMTAFPEYSISTHEFRPVDFLVKPVDTDRLRESVNIVYDIIKSKELSSKHIIEDSIFMYKFRKNMNMLNFDSILFFEKNARAVNIILDDGSKETFYEDFDELEKRLPSIFFRSSPKYIINLKKVYRVMPSGRNRFSVFFVDSNEEAVLNKHNEQDFIYRYHRAK